jgi:hypothetical protein
LTLTLETRYTDFSLSSKDKNNMGKENVLFIISYLAILAVLATCSYLYIYSPITYSAEITSSSGLILLLANLSSLLLIGVGFAIPLLFLATLLGWGQLFLLFIGKIQPHLGEHGLGKSLTILIKTIF